MQKKNLPNPFRIPSTAPSVPQHSDPRHLLNSIPEDVEPLLQLAACHVVESQQFDRDTLLQIFRLAAQYETTPALLHLPLTGKILISAFYEPSTRTRLSFESAWHRLGGAVMSITDAMSTGMAKGESITDIAEMFNHYGDLIVLRSSEADHIHAMLGSLRIPIINAGNGIQEHPTQAMADLYALAKWRPEHFAGTEGAVQRLRIGIIGVPCRMRTVRSLLTLLACFESVLEEVVVISREEPVFDPGQREQLLERGLRIRTTRFLEPELPHLDVVYINAIAWVGNHFEALGEEFSLSTKSPLKPGALILHPLARGSELGTDLDSTPHNGYFGQARGAVFVRMALMTTLVQRISAVMDTPQPKPTGGA